MPMSPTRNWKFLCTWVQHTVMHVWLNCSWNNQMWTVLIRIVMAIFQFMLLHEMVMKIMWWCFEDHLILSMWIASMAWTERALFRLCVEESHEPVVDVLLENPIVDATFVEFVVHLHYTRPPTKVININFEKNLETPGIDVNIEKQCWWEHLISCCKKR